MKAIGEPDWQVKGVTSYRHRKELVPRSGHLAVVTPVQFSRIIISCESIKDMEQM